MQGKKGQDTTVEVEAAVCTVATVRIPRITGTDISTGT